MHGLAALLNFRRIVPPPFVFDLFQPLNLAGSPIHPVTVDHRIYFWIAAAFRVVIFAENKLKVRVRGFLRPVCDAIQ